ncbi:hypothetical protein [Thalassotalea atypica]|uniref:hypothetical protein n=1 Tax=Thalassotalea atypica TaxID=2054316 RepID=UPI0025734042|nr:hypothetical protein [Thalassotalea atypica]
MRAFLTSPNAMSLSDTEQTLYQNSLIFIAELSLNLMAVKVENCPTDFLSWCKELHHICTHKVNQELLEPEQFKPLKKLTELLVSGISISQLKLARVLPWPVFAKYIHDNASIQALDERLALLSYVDEIKNTAMNELSSEDVLVLAGKHTAQHDPSIYKFDTEWFGATKGAKVFLHLLADFPEEFGQALQHIPVEGNVDYSHYQAFVNAYKTIFSLHANGEKIPLFPATRLLSMRRPDQFIVVTNSKLDVLSKGLGIVKLNNQSFDDYWHELIVTLRHCPWWKAAAPDDAQELALWHKRAILTDLFLFADDTLAQGSNYIKLRDKPKRTSSGQTRTIKRTKASAEELVNKALAQDDIPKYLLNMRSTIIKSVQDGKTVEQAITLMRNIFG